MLRSAGFVLTGFALWIAACSGDAEGGEETGSGSSTPDSSGSAGSGGDATRPPPGNGAGTGGSGSTTDSGGPSYSAREACELFAEASCNKGLECGLVLSQLLGQLICVQCSPAALNIIVDRCLADGTTDKPVAAVDRCVANLAAQPCSEACVDPSVDGCEVFGELELGDNQIVCDERCAE
jgi:hypothetical protein